MQEQQFAAGEVIFAEGDHSHDAYRIVGGQVQIGIDTDQGHRLLARLGPGEIFGEMGMIDDAPRAATAVAMKPTVLEVITEEDFHDFVLTDPERLQPYLSAVFERLRSTNLMLQMLLETGERPTDSSVASIAGGTLAAPGEASGTVGGESLEVHLVSVPSEKNKTPDFTPIDARIEKFPFRIGRRYFGREASVFLANDLYLPDSQPYHVSRSHCCIDWDGERVFVRDRGSRLGTIVNGDVLNKENGILVKHLNTGENTLVLGDPESPFVFRVVVSR